MTPVNQEKFSWGSANSQHRRCVSLWISMENSWLNNEFHFSSAWTFDRLDIFNGIESPLARLKMDKTESQIMLKLNTSQFHCRLRLS